MTKKPSICLNMIVRDEAHIVREVLACVVPHIDYWVVVDTGSTDGTQSVIREYMAELGIPGKLHERPWRNFGENRSEALVLAQGHCDYIWVIDADDLIVGDFNLDGLTQDLYEMRIGEGFTYWRPQLMRDGLPWSYRGVVHEYLYCASPFTRARLEGNYHIQSRRLGSRSADPEKYARDRDLLLAEVEKNPDDERSVFYLAQSYLDYGDAESALKWYTRRAEMGGWPEEVFYSLYRVAECMARLGEPWPQVLDAYLKAWSYRPSRAEPLYEIALHYQIEQDWQLGYLFAERAAQIRLTKDILFVRADVYRFSALDVQAICASWLGNHSEAYRLFRQLIASPHVAEQQKPRLAANRDISVPSMLGAAEIYPHNVANKLAVGRPASDVTLTVVGDDDLSLTERCVNSVLNSILDVDRIGRLVLIDTGMEEADCSQFAAKYPFFEIRASDDDELGTISALVTTRFWLHVGRGWQLFAPDHYIGRLTSILSADDRIDHVGLNLRDAIGPCGSFPAADEVRTGEALSRYVLTERRSHGPAMYDTIRLQHGGHVNAGGATLDEVNAIKVSPSAS